MKKVLAYLRPHAPRMALGFIIKFTGTLMDLSLIHIWWAPVDISLSEHLRGFLLAVGAGVLLGALYEYRLYS